MSFVPKKIVCFWLIAELANIRKCSLNMLFQYSLSSFTSVGSAILKVVCIGSLFCPFKIVRHLLIPFSYFYDYCGKKEKIVFISIIPCNVMKDIKNLSLSSFILFSYIYVFSISAESLEIVAQRYNDPLF